MTSRGSQQSLRSAGCPDNSCRLVCSIANFQLISFWRSLAVAVCKGLEQSRLQNGGARGRKLNGPRAHFTAARLGVLSGREKNCRNARKTTLRENSLAHCFTIRFSPSLFTFQFRWPTQTHQRVLQEPICPGVVGGKLDFPRYASFASIKLIHW